jgi:hypothetical protein
MQVLEASKRALADAEASFSLDLSAMGPPPRRESSVSRHDVV